MPRVMLVLPTETYRATAFLHAAEELGLAGRGRFQRGADTGGTDGGPRPHTRSSPTRGVRRSAQRTSRDDGQSMLSSASTKDRCITAATIAERLGLPTAESRRIRRGDARQTTAAQASHCSRDAAAERSPRSMWTPVSAPSTRPSRRTGLPCVVKPVDLAASRGVIRCRQPRCRQMPRCVASATLLRASAPTDGAADARRELCRRRRDRARRPCAPRLSSR